MSAQPQPAGYIYETPRSTVALAGGLASLFDLFASRLRGYFRNDDCVTVTLDGCRLFVECDDAVSCLREDEAHEGDAIQLRLEMITGAHEAWSTAHQAFADLVAVWPEITAHRAIPEPPASDLTLLAQARAIVVADQRASTSYIQRKLYIGYNKAAVLMDLLERDGIVSAPDPSGKRQVLVTE